MAAGLASLNELSSRDIHSELAAKTEKLAMGLKAAAERNGVSLSINYVGAMFGFFFTEEETISSYAQATACDSEKFKHFFHLMLDEGIYLAPSAFEAGFVCAAHSDEDIEQTLQAAARCFAKL
jgi:glutamate-1-semialdehyde 2,1-aminomutase